MEEYRDVHGISKRYDNIRKAIRKSDMSEKQKGKFDKFTAELIIGKAGAKVKDKRLTNYLFFLLKLHKYFKKDLDQITEAEATKFYTDLLENKIKRDNGMPYAEVTKDEFVRTLKRYLGWAWGKDNKKYTKCLRWMKDCYKKSNKRAITLEQSHGCIELEKNIRNKCLFDFLFDSGARIEEALNVRINDLKLDKDKKFYMVHLRGQKNETSDRNISLPLCSKYLTSWLKEHPTGEKTDFLFPINYDNALSYLP